MLKILKKLWRSTTFRLTLNYSLLAIFTAFFLIGFFYIQVFGALRDEYVRQINSTMQKLETVYEHEGAAQAVRLISLFLSDSVDSDQEIYLLLDQDKRTVVGNVLAVLELDKVAEGGVQKVWIEYAHHTSKGYVRINRLSGGETLIVGHEFGRLNDVNNLIKRVILASFILAVALVLLGSYIFINELKYRVGSIRLITDKVGRGDISKRIEITGEDTFSLIHHDINIMLDKIEELMKGVKHVSDTIAHNIRTPLTRVVWILRDAQSIQNTPTQVSHAHELAIAEVESLSVLLGKLLQISEIKAGVKRKEFKLLCLGVVAKDVLDLYSPIADDKGLLLSSGHIEEVWVSGDSDLLASALANLIDNAIKFACTSVVVSVKKIDATQVCFIVEDDGPGLPESDYDKVEKYFYRANSDVEGYGLGLTSVFGIVRLHGGELVFDYANGKFKVTVYLPV